MQTINCYIPLKLRLRGEPGEDDWANLEEALVAKYTSALKRSITELTKSHCFKAEMPEDVQEPFAPEWAGDNGYTLISYESGKPVQVPLLSGRAKTMTRQTLLQLIKQREQIRERLTARQAHVQTKPGERGTPSSQQKTFLIMKQLHLLDRQIDLLTREAGVASLADAWTLLRQLHSQFTVSKKALDLVRSVNELGEQSLPLHKMSGDIDMPDPAENVQSELERSFRDTFQTLALDIALFILEQSKTEAQAEEARYTTHTSELKVIKDIEGLHKHALHLATLEKEISDLKRSKSLEHGMALAASHQLPPDENRRLEERQKQLQEEIERKERIFEERKRASGHLILLARGVDYSKLAAAEMGQEQILHIHNLVADVIRNIDKTCEDLKKNNGELIWSLTPIIEIAKEVMEIAPGSYAEKLIDNEVNWRQRTDAEIDIILGVLGFALGIIGMFLTGGALVIVGAAISTTIAVRDIQQYSFKRRISHTSLDPAAALSQEDPSLVMVALSVAGAVVDIVAALAAFRNMVKAIRGAKTLKEAENAAGTAVEELAKANNLRTNVNKEALIKELENEARSLREAEQITKEARAAEAGTGGCSGRPPAEPPREAQAPGRTKPKGPGSKLASAEHLAESKKLAPYRLELHTIADITQEELATLNRLDEEAWDRVFAYVRGETRAPSVKGKIAEELIIHHPQYELALQRARELAAKANIPIDSVHFFRDIRAIAPTSTGAKLAELSDGAIVAIKGDRAYILTIFESKSPSNIRALAYEGKDWLGQIARDFERLRLEDETIVIGGRAFRSERVRAYRHFTEWIATLPPGYNLRPGELEQIRRVTNNFRVISGEVRDSILNAVAQRVVRLVRQ